MIKRNFNEEATSQSSTSVSADPEKNVYDKVNNYSQPKDENSVPNGTKGLDPKMGSEDSTKNSSGAQYEFANAIKEFEYSLNPGKRIIKESAPEPKDDTVKSFKSAIREFTSMIVAPEPTDDNVFSEGKTMKKISERMFMTVAEFNKKHPGLLRRIGKIKNKSKMEEEIGILKAKNKITDAEYEFIRNKWKLAQENPSMWKDLCGAMAGAAIGSFGGPLGTIAGATSGFATSKLHDTVIKGAKEDLDIKESFAPEPDDNNIFTEMNAPEPTDEDYIKGFFLNEIASIDKNNRLIESITIVENFKNFVNATTRVYFENRGKEPEAGDIVSTADASNIVTDAINGVIDTGDRDKIISDRDIEPLDGDISLANTIKIA